MQSVADFRAEIARQRLFIYQIAPLVGLHPLNLGRILNGKAPLTPAVAEKLEHVLKETRVQ